MSVFVCVKCVKRTCLKHYNRLHSMGETYHHEWHLLKMSLPQIGRCYAKKAIRNATNSRFCWVIISKKSGIVCCTCSAVCRTVCIIDWVRGWADGNTGICTIKGTSRHYSPFFNFLLMDLTILRYKRKPQFLSCFCND